MSRLIRMSSLVVLLGLAGATMAQQQVQQSDRKAAGKKAAGL